MSNGRVDFLAVIILNEVKSFIDVSIQMHYQSDLQGRLNLSHILRLEHIEVYEQFCTKCTSSSEPSKNTLLVSLIRIPQKAYFTQEMYSFVCNDYSSGEV